MKREAYTAGPRTPAPRPRRRTDTTARDPSRRTLATVGKRIAHRRCAAAARMHAQLAARARARAAQRRPSGPPAPPVPPRPPPRPHARPAAHAARSCRAARACRAACAAVAHLAASVGCSVRRRARAFARRRGSDDGEKRGLGGRSDHDEAILSVRRLAGRRRGRAESGGQTDVAALTARRAHRVIAALNGADRRRRARGRVRAGLTAAAGLAEATARGRVRLANAGLTGRGRRTRQGNARPVVGAVSPVVAATGRITRDALGFERPKSLLLRRPDADPREATAAVGRVMNSDAVRNRSRRNDRERSPPSTRLH